MLLTSVWKWFFFPTVGVLVPWQPHWFDFGSTSQNWRLFLLPAAITTKSLDIHHPQPQKAMFLTDQISGGIAHHHMSSNIVTTFTAYLHLTQFLSGYFEVWNHDVIDSAAVTPFYSLPSAQITEVQNARMRCAEKGFVVIDSILSQAWVVTKMLTLCLNLGLILRAIGHCYSPT